LKRKKMSNNELIDKIVENVGQEKFDEIILRIYSVRVISELNFDRETIDNIILPLSQLGIIKVEDKYFPPGGRPSNGRTRYYLFSISFREIVDSNLETYLCRKS